MSKFYASPPISDLRRTDPVHPPKPPARKDRARWCKGKEGVDHDYAISIPTNTDGFFSNQPCRAATYGIPDGRTWSVYLCKHRWVCTRCGRIKGRTTQDECRAATKAEKEN